MIVLLSAQSRLLFLIGCCAVLWSLESLAPLVRYPGKRLRRIGPNIALTLAVLLTNFVLSFIAASVSTFMVSNDIGLLALTRFPLWLDVLLSIAALDLFTYVAHVALHEASFAWRFHRVHHS
ncbi:MAG: hypothetical protein ABI837_20725, partial [Acidobacteriota bacterium]